MKGSMINMFKVGQHIKFCTKLEEDREGIICKLHKSGSHGTAEIKGAGYRKLTRKLSQVISTSV